MSEKDFKIMASLRESLDAANKRISQLEAELLDARRKVLEELIAKTQERANDLSILFQIGEWLKEQAKE